MNIRQKHQRARLEFEACCRAARNPAILTHLYVEISRSERLRLEAALALARDRSQEKLPAVAHRTNRTDWKITMELADFLRLAAPEKPVEETTAL